MKAWKLIQHGTKTNDCFRMESFDSWPLASNQVRIAVSHSGINFADVLSMHGKYGGAPKLPYTPGYEVVGRIVELGSAVENLALGMRVLAFTRFGGYADEAVLYPHQCVPIPEDWDGAMATALATQYVTAWYMVQDVAYVRPGDRVLVPAAAGGVGQALMDMVKARGGEAVGIVSRETSKKFLEERGHVSVVQVKDGAWWQLKDLDAFKVIFDASGGYSIRQGWKHLLPGGKLISYGASSRIGSWGLVRDLKLLFGFGIIFPVQKLIHSQGFVGVNMLVIADERPDILHALMKEVMAAVQSGMLPFPAAHTYPAAGLEEAYASILARRHQGKLALAWD